MPNGKPGDHPYTDIVIHGRDIYSARAAALIREIAGLVDDKARRKLADMLFLEYNDFGAPGVAKLEQVLTEMRDRARAAAAKDFQLSVLTRITAGDAVIVEGPQGQPLLRDAAEVDTVLGECFGGETRFALLYAENLPPAFFDVSSSQAGDILQKLRNYGVRLAVVAPPGSVEMSSRFGELAAAERRDNAFRIFESRDDALAWLARAHAPRSESG